MGLDGSFCLYGVASPTVKRQIINVKISLCNESVIDLPPKIPTMETLLRHIFDDILV